VNVKSVQTEFDREWSWLIMKWAVLASEYSENTVLSCAARKIRLRYIFRLDVMWRRCGWSQRP